MALFFCICKEIAMPAHWRSVLPFATSRLHSHSRENAGQAPKLSTGIFWLDTCVGEAIHRPLAAGSPKGVHNPSCTRKKLYKPIDRGGGPSAALRYEQSDGAFDNLLGPHRPLPSPKGVRKNAPGLSTGCARPPHRASGRTPVFRRAMRRRVR